MSGAKKIYNWPILILKVNCRVLRPVLVCFHSDMNVLYIDLLLEGLDRKQHDTTGADSEIEEGEGGGA